MKDASVWSKSKLTDFLVGLKFEDPSVGTCSILGFKGIIIIMCTYLPDQDQILQCPLYVLSFVVAQL